MIIIKFTYYINSFFKLIIQQAIQTSKLSFHLLLEMGIRLSRGIPPAVIEIHSTDQWNSHLESSKHSAKLVSYAYCNPLILQLLHYMLQFFLNFEQSFCSFWKTIDGGRLLSFMVWTMSIHGADCQRFLDKVQRYRICENRCG